MCTGAWHSIKSQPKLNYNCRAPTHLRPNRPHQSRSLRSAMGRAKKKTRTPRSALLSRCHRRPSVAAGLSSKATRMVINRHHTLQKKLAQALARDDHEAVKALKAEIQANGGIETYQKASIIGQSKQRGGDSSKVLMEWINEIRPSKFKPSDAFHLLEIGALSTENACSKSAMFHVTRIDLHSQHPDILAQDFMKRPLPTNTEEKFDIISLSLVLNYVPTPTQRGEMLLRTTAFLQRRTYHDPSLSILFPSLFLVLPAPCITNSRYLNEQRLEEIMNSLGYSKCRQKLSTKLLYQLWVLRNQPCPNVVKFKKEEVNKGQNRNNFAIVLC
ncbi:putative methyltransferase-domain-containing protein [Kalaharituber pfeilii]|nr:putative methyltransferase-domain-containing protein [Kalaharituber pfeilii]